jgi:hypothetical protein
MSLKRTNKRAQEKQDVGREHGRVHVSANFINHDRNVRGDEKDAPGECEARYGVLQGANRTLQVQWGGCSGPKMPNEMSRTGVRLTGVRV